MSHATMGMNLGDLMLSEVNQPWKDKSCCCHLHESSKGVKFLATETRMVGAWGKGREKWRGGVQWA